MEAVSARVEEESELKRKKHCIVKSGEEAEVRASAELRRSLQLMVNDPAFSDVVFLCNDAKRVHASRMILAGRSEVLKSMLMNGMAESSLPEIKVPEISSPVLLAVFEFLYTGTLCDHLPQGWGMAWKVIIGSKFFLLPNLEMITRKFLHSLTLAVDDLPMAASMLTEAVALDVLGDNTDANLMELVNILSSGWSHSTFVKSLSEDAFHYLLRNSCYDFDLTNCELSFEEYLRFRQVLRWCAYHSDLGSYIMKELPTRPSDRGSDATEELLTFIAPNVEEALSVCRNPDSFARDKVATESVRRLATCWHADEASHRSARKLMSNIDCRWIHPELLTKVVEPLEVISDKHILDSFRYHARRRPMIWNFSDLFWEHGEVYTSASDGVIAKARNGVGLAVISAPLSRSFGIHQWRFTLKKPCHEFLEMGFMAYGRKKPQLDGRILSLQHGAMVVRFHGEQVSANKTGTDGLPHWTVLIAHSSWTVPVKFTYNALEHTCALSINHKDFGICWEDLPSEVYYPAVSLGATSNGQVRAEILSGFDFL